MHSYIRLIVLSAFCLSLHSLYSCKECSKKIPCPGYKDTLLDSWFPYQDAQTLVFKSNLNVYDTLLMNLIYVTGENEYSSSTGNCTASKTFSSIRRDSANYAAFGISLTTGRDAYSSSNNTSASIQFYRKIFTGQNLSQSGFNSFSVLSEFNIVPQNFTNYSLNGTTYPAVQSIRADTSTNHSPGVYKILIAKNYGIIAYETNPGAVTWIKQ